MSKETPGDKLLGETLKIFGSRRVKQENSLTGNKTIYKSLCGFQGAYDGHVFLYGYFSCYQGVKGEEKAS